MEDIAYAKKNNLGAYNSFCDESRKNEIMSIKIQNPGINESIFDSEFIFYYDETNNFRKVYLDKNKGFNIGKELINSNFCLGGLVLKKGDNLNINGLKSNLKLQKTVQEIKLKHIAEGDFLQILDSSKLTIFLDCLLSNNIYVHFSIVNILYWSIVDIVDSLIDPKKWFNQMEFYYKVSTFPLKYELTIDEYLFQTYFGLKNELYKAVLISLNQINNLFLKYKYPNINKNDIKNFIKELIKLLNIENLNEIEYSNLKTFFEMFENSEKAPFITDGKDYMLLENFAIFYTRNVCLFNKSQHIFDKEENIINQLQEFNPIKDIKFKFADSKNEPYIQISDIFIGIMGKMADFLSNKSVEYLNQISLKGTKKINLEKIILLLNKSISECPAFSHSAVPIEIIEKNGIFFNKI